MTLSSYIDANLSIPRATAVEVEVFDLRLNGASRIRTGGLSDANRTLYQLSYGPVDWNGRAGHQDNAERMNCRMMVEGANSPTTPSADSILTDKGVTIVPDVLANAGGIVVSYFEWVQNLQHSRWDEDQVNDQLGEIMRRAFHEVADRAKKNDTSCAPPRTSWPSSVEAASTRGCI